MICKLGVFAQLFLFLYKKIFALSKGFYFKQYLLNLFFHENILINIAFYFVLMVVHLGRISTIRHWLLYCNTPFHNYLLDAYYRGYKAYSMRLDLKLKNVGSSVTHLLIYCLINTASTSTHIETMASQGLLLKRQHITTYEEH